MSEELAQQAADRVREVIAAAERRAEEIVRDAEVEAERIRASARAETPDPSPEPPVPRPDPTPPGDPVPEPPAPQSPAAPAPEPTPGLAASNGSAGDDAAVRLVAMKLAIDGKGREEIASELDAKFGAGDRGAILDDVLARAGR